MCHATPGRKCAGGLHIWLPSVAACNKLGSASIGREASKELNMYVLCKIASHFSRQMMVQVLFKLEFGNYSTNHHYLLQASLLSPSLQTLT